ncbi:MAG: hypothetical protein QN183_02695 [Armatimonadota bacterium]|nr:hypothetical protein [Armatimonadota bacterium]MDR7532333.1 hypothetical protein [Armatimonadota bacterium]MDR7535260.1 hypothetical protein [Armatimonadota bacterium]
MGYRRWLAVLALTALVIPAVPTPGNSAPTPGPSPGASPSPAPSPSPTTAPGTWRVRSSAARVENTDLVVTGTVENRAMAQTAYAEVRAFDAAGRLLGEGNAPLQPALVRTDSTATFEVRVPVSAIVRRYEVIIRAANRTTVLARHVAEIRTPEIFAPLVARMLQVTVRATKPDPGRADFVATVTNGASLPVESAVVTVDVKVTCRLGVQARFVEETWTATVRVQRLAVGASADVPLALTGGVCEGVAVSWSASYRPGEVKIGS